MQSQSFPLLSPTAIDVAEYGDTIEVLGCALSHGGRGEHTWIQIRVWDTHLIPRRGMTQYKVKIGLKSGTCTNSLATKSVLGQRARERGARVFLVFYLKLKTT